MPLFSLDVFLYINSCVLHQVRQCPDAAAASITSIVCCPHLLALPCPTSYLSSCWDHKECLPPPSFWTSSGQWVDGPHPSASCSFIFCVPKTSSVLSSRTHHSPGPRIVPGLEHFTSCLVSGKYVNEWKVPVPSAGAWFLQYLSLLVPELLEDFFISVFYLLAQNLALKHVL